MTSILTQLDQFDADFERKHPRAQDGKFGDKGKGKERLHLNKASQYVLNERKKHGDKPINKKVIPLVNALNKRGYVTTMSGDMETNKIVYVDLDLKHELTIQKAKLPEGWIATSMLASDTYKQLGMSLKKMGWTWDKHKERLAKSLPQIRLVYTKGVPTEDDVLKLVSALDESKKNDFSISAGLQQFDADFERKHPRGADHENPGRFAPKGLGAATKLHQQITEGNKAKPKKQTQRQKEKRKESDAVKHKELSTLRREINTFTHLSPRQQLAQWFPTYLKYRHAKDVLMREKKEGFAQRRKLGHVLNYTTKGGDRIRLKKIDEYDPASWPKFIQDEMLHNPKALVSASVSDVHVAEKPNASGLLWLGQSMMATTGSGKVTAYSAERISKAKDGKWSRIKEFRRKKQQIIEDVRTEMRKDPAAVAAALMLSTGIRVDSKQQEGVYGATSIQGKHLSRRGDFMVLQFPGKGSLKVIKGRPVGPKVNLRQITGDPSYDVSKDVENLHRLVLEGREDSKEAKESARVIQTMRETGVVFDPQLYKYLSERYDKVGGTAEPLVDFSKEDGSPYLNVREYVYWLGTELGKGAKDFIEIEDFAPHNFRHGIGAEYFDDVMAVDFVLNGKYKSTKDYTDRMKKALAVGASFLSDGSGPYERSYIDTDSTIIKRLKAYVPAEKEGKVWDMTYPMRLVEKKHLKKVEGRKSKLGPITELLKLQKKLTRTR